MEKTELIQNLRAKVGEDNCQVISDKTFESIADIVLPNFAKDEEITDETWKLPVSLLNQYAGQKRHDDTVFSEKYKTDYENQHKKDVEDRIKKSNEDAVNKALDEFKKAHPEIKDGKQDQKTDDIDAKIKNSVADAVKGLFADDSELGKALKTINGFVTTQNQREKTEQKNRVREELKKHLVNLKANNEACIDDALDDIDYGDDPKFDDLKQKAIDAYEKRYKRYYADGGKPFGGKGNGGDDGGEETYVKKKLKQLEDERKANANYAEEIAKGFQ